MLSICKSPAQTLRKACSGHHGARLDVSLRPDEHRAAAVRPRCEDDRRVTVQRDNDEDAFEL